MDQRALRDGKEEQRNIGGIQKTLHSWWKKHVAFPVRQIDDYAKHILWNHNREADHLANLGAEGKSKTTIQSVKITETRKGVRGYWEAAEGKTEAAGVVMR